MRESAEDVAGMALAGGWLVAFTITAAIANRLRPYRRRAAVRATTMAEPTTDTLPAQPSVESSAAIHLKSA
jgi:hypothetical protein